MQDTRLNLIGALTGSERPDGLNATLQTSAKRQLGYVASRLFCSGLFGELVVVCLGILIIRASG